MPTVLVVDDEPDILRLLMTVLREEGFHVEATSEVSAAVHWLIVN